MTALRAAISAGGAEAPQRCLPGAAHLAGELCNVDGAALGLLWRLRGGLAGASPPIVQFAPCSAACAAGAVAHGFARAASAAWGRTLLINAREGEAAGVLPDAFVPRLYHQCLGGAALYAMLSRPGASATPGGGMFDIVVIDQASPFSGEAASITAQLCTGTVLVVQAGVSDLASITAACGRIACMGGAVLGTVLTEVPAWVLRH
jgi:hypothetical protein